MHQLTPQHHAQLKAFLLEVQAELAKPAAATYEKEGRLLALLGQFLEVFGPILMQLLIDALKTDQPTT